MTDFGAERMVLWSGLDLRDGSSPDDSDPDTAPQEPAAGGGTEQFELITGGSPRFPAARFLVGQQVTSTEEIAEANEHLRTDLETTWSVLYRAVAETGPQLVAPHAIYFVGVNPPRDMSEGEITAFNDFYTNVHMPEVTERRHGLRATRYEQVHVLRHPRGVAPYFLAVYELDEEWAAKRRHIGGPYAKGPDIWQRHTTPWRLWYRRLAG